MSKISKKIRVGVIFGGRSGEHEVSIVSAISVMKSLNKKKYQVVPIGITKEGRWISGNQAVHFLKEGIKQLPFKSIFTPDPTEKSLLNIQSNNLKPNSNLKLTMTEIDVVFPLVHGTYGEDGKLQGLLEMANIAYVGSEVLGSALAMDKVVQKQLTDVAGLPSVKYDWFLKKEWKKNQIKIINRLENNLGYSMFTKPANLGSSVGVGKCHNRKELVAGINIALKYDRKIIVEEGIEDVKEIEVSVLGNDLPRASVPGEIISSNEFYDYDAKYVDGKSQAIIPARLPKKTIKDIMEIAEKAFGVLNLSGMARVDFLVRKKNYQVYLNEVNTIPGFTSISMYPKLWEASGLSYQKLLDKLVELALKRHQEKNSLATSYQPKQTWYK